MIKVTFNLHLADFNPVSERGFIRMAQRHGGERLSRLESREMQFGFQTLKQAETFKKSLRQTIARNVTLTP
jgi:hypothetical protein